MRYATPEAFRTALEARIKHLAVGDNATIQRIRKRVAFERLLARLQQTSDSPWILKGAFALDLRFRGQARSTKDLDLGFDIALLGEASAGQGKIREQLAEAVSRPLADYFVFSLPTEGEEIIQEPAARTYRFLAQASLANRLFEDFRIDVGVGSQLVVPVDEVPESDTLTFAGIAPRAFRASAISEQFADKIHALTFPWQDRENTRVKDLVDLVLILETSPPDPAFMRHVITAVFEHRRTHPVPATISDPPASWASQYKELAAEVGLTHLTVDAAAGFLRAYWTKLSSRSENGTT